jgi:hypothetical protein
MFLRTIVFSALLLICGGTALAQRPGPEFWRKASCEPVEPRTKLEGYDDRHSSVIIKGFTRVRTVEVGGVRIDAVEMRELGNVSRAKGLVVALLDSDLRSDGARSRSPRNIAMVDYEEIDSLLNAIDVISRVDENVTKLVSFEARYRTQGDLEMAVFRQTRTGTAATMTTGLCDLTTVTLSLDELAKVRAIIQEAKTRLDEIR